MHNSHVGCIQLSLQIDLYVKRMYSKIAWYFAVNLFYSLLSHIELSTLVYQITYISQQSTCGLGLYQGMSESG